MFDWACLWLQSQEKCSRKSHLFHAGRFGPGLSPSVGERPDEAWHSTVGAYRRQPTTTYWPGSRTDPVRTFLSQFFGGNLSPPLAEMTVSSYCPVNDKKPISIKHAYKTQRNMCPAKHIWGQPEFTLSSTWIWTVCCDTALIPQSVLALAWLNLGLQEAHATWRLEMQQFLSLFSLSLMAKYKESLNLLVEFTLWMPQSVKRTDFDWRRRRRRRDELSYFIIDCNRKVLLGQLCF